MPEDTGAGDANGIQPDEAFALLGNPTRVDILRELGAASGTLSFTELRDRVGIERGMNFNYHLDRLLGHFVGDAADGYQLRPAGRRIVEAVLSGTITESPTIDRTEIDISCWYCGASTIEMSYRDELVTLYCDECGGTYGDSSETFGSTTPADRDRLGAMTLPPAGIRTRSPPDIARAALNRYLLEMQSVVANVCPRCSAPVERPLVVCEDHTSDGGVCDQCDRRYAVAVDISCTNCILQKRETILGLYVLAMSPVRAFLTNHGFDPVSPSFERLFGIIAPYEEEIRESDPLRAAITYTVDTDSITVTVDDELNLIEVTES